MKSRVYGYVRISTVKQSIERQIRNIENEYPEAIIVVDKCTGRRLDRPGWQKIYKQVKAGDTVVFDSVSRMSRDADAGFELYKELYDKGVNLVFIKEPHINTSVYRSELDKRIDVKIETGSTPVDRFGNGIVELINELLMDIAREQIRIAFEQSEKEVDDLRQRTIEGIETARLNGKQIGQKAGVKLTTKKSQEVKPIILKHAKAFGGSLSDAEVMQMTGLARNTYYKYKAELKAEC